MESKYAMDEFWLKKLDNLTFERSKIFRPFGPTLRRIPKYTTSFGMILVLYDINTTGVDMYMLKRVLEPLTTIQERSWIVLL